MHSPDRTGGRAARWALGALLVVAWALILSGAIPDQQVLLADAIQLLTAATTTVLYLRAARGRAGPLGRGTLPMGLALLAWTVSEGTWGVLSRIVDGSIDWVNYGYAAATLGFAFAVRRSVADVRIRSEHAGPVRRVVDTILLVLAAGTVWWQIVSGPHFSAGVPTLIATLLAADATFVVTALMAWTRCRNEKLGTIGLAVASSVTLLVVDLSYGAGLPVASYGGGSLLDLGWFLVLLLLGLAALPRRRSARRGLSRTAAWAQASVPPVVALVVLTAVALVQSESAAQSDPVLTAAEIALMLALILRHLLHFAETFALNDQLAESGTALAHQADHDDLTGLLGRAAFIRHASEVVADRGSDHLTMGILWVDLDAFKRINDSLGHKVGDEVLRTVSARLRAIADDDDLVARLGGDEFVVLRPRIRPPAAEWAERVRSALAVPVVADGLTLTVTCSIGLVESAASDDDISQLLIDGDLALYQAKRLGRNRVEHYSSALRASQEQRTELAVHVRNMIDSGNVVVRYQPVIELASGEMVGAEGLARIPGPDGTELAPAQFLPHVEALGLLPDLANIVIGRACTDFAALPDLGWVSVNITSEDLADPQLPDKLATHLAASGLPPQRLVLEINERVVPEPHILSATRRITAMGVQVALDDFGTGWSSLAQLRDLSLGMVKIDQSVVAAAGRGDDRLASMLVASVALARSLGLQVIAEGIEQSRESVTAQAAGAEYGQGFLWSAALDLEHLQRRHGTAPADDIRAVPADRQPLTG